MVKSKEKQENIKTQLKEAIENLKETKNEIIIGDLQLSSTNISLNELSSKATQLLQEKSVSDYLNISIPAKRMSGL